jgi:RNA polymerase sigma-70 factor (ECF subfamily)
MLRYKLSKAEENEFEIHVKHNMKRAYFTALGFVGSHDTAVDLSQEAFVRAYKDYKNFDGNKKFFTWYYKILKNLCLNFIRDSKNRPHVGLFESCDALQESKGPSENLEKEEIQKIVGDEIFRLKEDEREIIILKEFQNLSYKEISELMNIPLGTVMSRLFYARKKLAKRLKGVL